MEKEQEPTKNRLDEIRENCRNDGMFVGQAEIDRSDLLTIVDAAFEQIEDFKRYAKNIRNNNHISGGKGDHFIEWEARADAYDYASAYLLSALYTSVDGLS